MPGFIFNSTLRPYQAPVDLGTLERTYNKLEEGHQQTIGLASAYKTQLASLDLNAEEDAWRQEKIAQIDNAINNNLVYGNAYTAMDDVMKEIGDIASDPGMIGRIRAQKQYTDWLTKLDESKLPQDYKNYYKEVNKYHYEDIRDANGKVIGGTDWQPTDNWVDAYDMNSLAKQAIEMIAEEAGQTNQVRFLDKDGKPTTDPNATVTGEWYDDVTMQWKRITPERINEAIKTIINNNPAAYESLKQDYKIANWKASKGEAAPGLRNEAGYKYTFDEYVQSRITPYSKFASYNNVFTSRKFGDGLKAQRALNASKVAGNGGTPLSNASTITGGQIETRQMKNTMPSEAQAIISTSKATLQQMFNKYGLDEGFDINKANSEQINALIQQIPDANERYRAIKQAKEYFDNKTYLAGLTKDLNPEQAQQFEAFSAIEGMGDDPNPKYDKDGNYIGSNNPYYQQYINAVENLYGNSDKLGQVFTNDASVREFVNAMGGVDNMKKLGVRQVTDEDGHTMFTIDKSNAKSFSLFMKAAQQAYNAQNSWYKFANEFQAAFNYGDNLYQINKDGSKNAINFGNFEDIAGTIAERTGAGALSGGAVGTGIGAAFGGIGALPGFAIGTAVGGTTGFLSGLARTIPGTPNFIYRSVNNIYDNLQQDYNTLLETPTIEVGQRTYGHATPKAAELASMALNDPEGASKYTAKIDIAQDEALALMRKINLTQAGAVAVTENGLFEDIPTKDLEEYTKYLRSAQLDHRNISIMQDPEDYTWGAAITIPGKIDNKGNLAMEPITVYVHNAFDDAVTQSWNNDTSMKAAGIVNRYRNSNRPINIGNLSILNGTIDYDLINSTGGYTLQGNNQNVAEYNCEDAKTLVDQYLRMERLDDILLYQPELIPTLTVEAINKLIDSYVGTMQLYDPDYDAVYSKQTIIDNIRNLVPNSNL